MRLVHRDVSQAEWFHLAGEWAPGLKLCDPSASPKAGRRPAPPGRRPEGEEKLSTCRPSRPGGAPKTDKRSVHLRPLPTVY